MTEQSENFHIVWCPTSDRPPKVKHDTFESATREAERLAELNIGHRFYVLTSRGYAAIEKPKAEFENNGIYLGFPGSNTTVDMKFKSAASEKPWLPSGDGWVEWEGGENPAPGAWVEFLLRATRKYRGETGYARSSGLRWSHIGVSGDIVAYRLACKLPRVLKHGEYQVGDLVRYTGRGPGRFASGAVGHTGFFHEIGDSGFCLVDWAGIYNESPGGLTHINNIEHESLPQFEVGDEVEDRATGALLRVSHITPSGLLQLLRADNGDFAETLPPENVVLIRPAQHRHEPERLVPRYGRDG